MSKQRRIKRLFNFAFGALAMLAVALLSAFISMRLAIHGREVQVPSLSGLTISQAQARVRSKGLNLLVENRFYSTVVPAGHILSQNPVPGETVRRSWQVRVTESLGGQQVSIPDVVGQSERSATIALRRLSLDLGSVAYLQTNGAPDVIIAQTPPAATQGIDGPRVSLLVSQTPDAQSPDAFVMPSLTGLSQYAATVRAAAAGLHIAAPEPTPDPDAQVVGDPTNPAATVTPAEAPYSPPTPTGNVVAQSPPAGHRVVRGAAVHLVYAQPTPDPTLIPATPTPPPPTP
jgi:beta-lactam-binding protein with PASTA domain